MPAPRDPKTQADDAQAILDALRHEAGGALTGAEIRKRKGIGDEDGGDAPPLDWRLTPRNVIAQLAALAVFLIIFGFLGWLVWSSVSTIFNAP